MPPRPRARPGPVPSIGVGFAVLAAILLVGSAAGAPSITGLSLEPVTGDVSRAGPNDWVTVESHRLNLTGGSATGVLVNVTNFHGDDATGRIAARALTLDGQVVSKGNTTVYVRKDGRTARCSIGFDAPAAIPEFAIVLVSVDTTVDVSRQAADCVSRGRGGPPGN